jgi:hypothetical protein
MKKRKNRIKNMWLYNAPSTMENNSKAKLSHLYNYGCRFLEKMAWLEGESDDDNEEDEERYVDLDNNCS